VLIGELTSPTHEPSPRTRGGVLVELLGYGGDVALAPQPGEGSLDRAGGIA
jgi:hypothetical protein